MTTSHTGQYSPYELVFGKRPRFDRIRVFGCDMYEHMADLPKVPGGLRARKGYFFGLPEDSPTGYLMLRSMRALREDLLESKCMILPAKYMD